ncbi:hypothetical protein R0K04_09970 [Pseudoalteromonas sp. SIMBA_153]
MRISINENSDSIAEFDQLNIHGREAVGGYAFTFVLRGNRKACEKNISIFDIRLSIALSEPIKPLVNLIPASNQCIQCHQYPNNSEQIAFEVVLTKEQINTLEEYRQDSDLKMNLGLRALTLAGNAPTSSYDTSDVIIQREQWLKVLNRAGFRQTILFEVPLPTVSNDFASFYSKAQGFIETGHYKESVIQCRHIIEKIESSRDDKSLSSAANKKAHDRHERQGMNSIERLLSMREQLKNVCQLGAHGDESFTRSQAKSILAMTMALLAEPTIGFSE